MNYDAGEFLSSSTRAAVLFIDGPVMMKVEQGATPQQVREAVERIIKYAMAYADAKEGEPPCHTPT